jgi:hypothetical protein
MIDYASREAYQVAAEGYLRGGHQSGALRQLCAGRRAPYSRPSVVPRVCVGARGGGADIDDPDTLWLMRGSCMNCHHRSYTNCSCGEFAPASKSFRSASRCLAMKPAG